MSKTILGIILSGGAGKRFGGKDKGLLHYQGQALVASVIARLAPQVDDLVLCVHRNKQAYQAILAHTIMDASIEFEGPMAGISAAINHYKNARKLENYEYLAIAPCDVPKLLPSQVEKLKEALNNSMADVAVAHDGVRRQNLHCLIRTNQAQAILDYYNNGGRAMHQWLKQVRTEDVDFSPHAKTFLNINRRQQLAHIG